MLLSTNHCKPANNSQELLNPGKSNLLDQFLLLDSSTQEVCFDGENDYFEESETSPGSSNISTLLTELDIYSILNQLDFAKVPCKGELDISVPIQSELQFETISHSPGMALITPAQVVWAVKVLKGVRNLRMGQGKAFIRVGSKIRSVPIRPLPNLHPGFLAQQRKAFYEVGNEGKDRMF